MTASDSAESPRAENGVAPPIRWGIMGTGMIAALFAEDLRHVDDAKLAAIGSRRAETAEAFASRFDVPQAHASYETLVRGDVDVVYVATPHAFHAENTLLALEAGVPVLCEKAFAMNAREAKQMVSAAREHDLFLMEAMWTRFMPSVAEVRRVLERGQIGPVQYVGADISTVREFNPDDRLFDPELGGGALLDLGVYPVAWTFDFFGSPDRVASMATLGPTGVDMRCSGLFEYDDGPQVVWHASLEADAGRALTMAGPEGRIHCPRNWWKGRPFERLTPEGEPVETLGRPYEGNGYQFEAEHVVRCLREGRTESPVMPLDESLAIMRAMDALRDEWGLEYPGEA